MGVFFVGCDIFKGKDDDPKLDEQLEAALVDASNGQGMDYFRLPESTDFNAIPQDPRNPITAKKVELGQLLYHETALNINAVKAEGMGTESCASCHHAAAGFQAGRIQGIGEGGWGFGQKGEARTQNPNYDVTELDIQPIRTPSAMNGAYQEAQLWNGQFGALGINAGTQAFWTPGTPKADNSFGYEGLEIQAIAGLKVHRMGDVDQSIATTHARYTQLFAEAFPGQPIDREHAGLAIAAFERTLMANQSPFQKWLRGTKDAMTEQEKRGAILFFDKANCAACHTGPALNSMTFYALGMENLNGPGVYGDPSVDASRFGRGSFTGNAADNYKFKTPQIYNLMDSPFYGHGGTFKSVREVVEYKNAAIPSNSEVPESQLAAEFVPLNLTADEMTDLTAFIEGALYDPDLFRYVPNSVPSGNCLPANDSQTRADLNCN
ncbi:MAG: cytochrome c peroxidase [Rhodothermales bacterium]